MITEQGLRQYLDGFKSELCGSEPRWIHPIGKPPDQDEVIEEESILEGHLVAIFPRWRTAKVHSERHAIAYNLFRALRWGAALFGTSYFAVFEGPLGEPVSKAKYYVVGVSFSGEFEVHGALEFAGLGIGTYEVTLWQPYITTPEGDLFLLRVLVADDDRLLFPLNNPGAILEFFCELKCLLAQSRENRELKEEAVYDIFYRVAITQDDEEKARLLAEFDANAFSLLATDDRLHYIEILIDAWTKQPQEVAIVEIMKTVEKRDELNTIIDILKMDKVFEKLIDDLDSELWSLLAVIGRNFGTHQLTPEILFNMIEEKGSIIEGAALWTPGMQIKITEEGVVLDVDLIASLEQAAEDFIAELKEAGRSFVRMLVGIYDGIEMLVTEPDKVILGIGQLVKVVFMLGLAAIGYEPAVEFVNAIWNEISKKIMYVFEGALILGVGRKVMRRIRWTILWEIASFFVGVGEIKAIANSGSVARLLKVFRTSRRVTEIEGPIARFQRLATMLSKQEMFAAEEDMLRLISYLPDDDVIELERRLRFLDLDDVQDITKVAEVNHFIERTRLISALEDKLKDVGKRLSENVLQGFHRIAVHSGFHNHEILSIIKVIPGKSIDRFMRALNEMPVEAFGRQVGSRRYLFFYNLAQRPRSQQFLLEHGYDLFSDIYRRSSYNFKYFEENLSAIKVIERHWAERSEMYSDFLDGIQKGNPEALVTLKDARQAWRIGISKGLPEPEIERVYRAIIERNSRTLNRILGTLSKNLKKLGMETKQITALKRRIRRRNRTRHTHIGKTLGLPEDTRRRRLDQLGDPLFLQDQIERRLHELMWKGPEAEFWWDVLDDADELAEEARVLRYMVEASEKLKTIAVRDGGGEMIATAYIMLYYPRPPGRIPKSSFEDYVDILATRYFRGYFGETEIAFHLGRDYIFLKGPDPFVTIRGTDLIAVERNIDGWVLIIDNKAISNSEVKAVSALTGNFPRNFNNDIMAYSRLADAEDVPDVLRSALERLRKAQPEVNEIFDHHREFFRNQGYKGKKLESMLKEKILNDPGIMKEVTELLEKYNIKLVVSGAGGQVTGLEETLEKMGIELLSNFLEKKQRID